jgi:hypothetical protein
MGTILSFRADGRTRPDDAQRLREACEIVIFPGVRIERQDAAGDPDSAHESTGRGKLDGTNARRRPRKSS